MGNVNAFDRFHLKVNIGGSAPTHGYQFQFDFPALTAKADRIDRGNVLGQLYSGCCARDCRIVSVICNVMQAGKKGQTIECLNSAIPSDFPGTTALAAATGNITLGDTGGTEISDKAAKVEASAELDVGAVDQAAYFRFEGEEYKHVTRAFNGLPDGYVERSEASQLDPEFVFYTPGGVNYTPDTVPDTVRNFWTNYKPLMDYIVKHGVIVKKIDIGDAAITTDTLLWTTYDIDRVVYERIGRKKVGAPFGLSPGRRAA